MRFTEIRTFSVDELYLDEENYRFSKADDQQECIEKIYQGNPSSFIRLMESIAEDDLGEPILVFIDENGYALVTDGNRRTSVIKVLHNPNLAPTPSVRKRAIALKNVTQFNFSEIQAQTSTDLVLIQRTLIERHSSKGGTRRIPWSALAASRFEYDTDSFEDGHYWQATALIYKTEEHIGVEQKYLDFINSKDYSHETFTRIVRTAINAGVISKEIFLESDKRLRGRLKKHLLDDAINKCCRFLESMINKDISLARGENFADKKRLDNYLKSFEKAPLSDKEKAEKNQQVTPEQPSPKVDSSTNQNSPDNDDSDSNAENPVDSGASGNSSNISGSSEPNSSESNTNNNSTRNKSRNDPNLRKYLFPSNFAPKIYDDIFNRIFKEIKRLELSDNADFSLSVTVLLRVFLEKIYLDYRVKVQKNNNTAIKVHEVMKEIHKHVKDNDKSLNKVQSSALEYFNKTASNTSYVLSPQTLGAFAHGAHIPNSRQLKLEWDNIQAIIEYLIEKIQ